MPTYDFKCKTCDQSVTITAGIKETITTPICGACQSEMVRNYGLGTITFKGPGFYRTDK